MRARIYSHLGSILSSLFIAGILCALVAPASFCATSQDQIPTFSKDVARIFQKSCQNCHHPGSIAPMSLVTYQDVRPWARSIRLKVATRIMPPWHIDRNVGVQKFKNDPSLSDAEIATIVSWVDHGAPEGNPADLPATREFTDDDQWQIKPDLIVAMDKPYILPANSGDQYYDFDLDPHFKEDRYLEAVQTRTVMGYSVVHHFSTSLVDDPQVDPDGMFLSEYSIGKGAEIYPKNVGRLVKAGSTIHITTHMHSDTKDTPVKVEIGLKFYPKGAIPKYAALAQNMGINGTPLDIRAGQVARKDGYFRLPRPAILTAYGPHFHTLGRAQCIEAIYPDVRADSARPGPAKTETISCVSNPQYGWTLMYNYADDVAPLLPAGTIIHVTTYHENTSSNPFDLTPMNWIGDGQRSNDEMAFAWIGLYYLDQADYLQRVQARKAQASKSEE